MSAVQGNSEEATRGRSWVPTVQSSALTREFRSISTTISGTSGPFDGKPSGRWKTSRTCCAYHVKAERR